MRLRAGHLAALAVLLWAAGVAVNVMRDVCDYPHHTLRPLDWIVAGVLMATICLQFIDGRSRFPLPGLYLAGLTWIGMLLIHRDLSPGRFVVWTGICELTGFLLVAALAGWMPQRFAAVIGRWRTPAGSPRWLGTWFYLAQASLVGLSALLIGWILLDPAFCALGHGVALFGLAGRFTSCPAALMLLGTTIVMAWQTRAAWRAAWQYAALISGVLLSSSIGWARVDASTDSPWFQRGIYLLVSISMMTLLTSFGLARVLPRSGDWLVSARRAAPLFGGLALLLAAAILMHWYLR